VQPRGVGKRMEGQVDVKWDGVRNDGKPADSAQYFFKVSATNPSGHPIDVSDKLEGKVTGVTAANGQTFLLVGDQKVAIHEVSTIKDPSITSGNQPFAGNLAGTKSEDKVTGNAGTQISVGDLNAKKSDVASEDVQIDDEAVAALRGETDAGPSDARLDPMMPLMFR